MAEFAKFFMRQAKIEQNTQKVFCPNCDKSNYAIFRKDSLGQGIYLHHAKCNECGQIFGFKVNPKGEAFAD